MYRGDSINFSAFNGSTRRSDSLPLHNALLVVTAIFIPNFFMWTQEPRTCNIPWAGIGERTSHPISKKLASEGQLNIYCFRRLASFVPESNVTKGAPKGRKLNMYTMHWLEMDGDVCYRQGHDLICR